MWRLRAKRKHRLRRCRQALFVVETDRDSAAMAALRHRVASAAFSDSHERLAACKTLAINVALGA